MRKYTGVVVDTSGNVTIGASVTIYVTGTTTLATLYSDEGITQITNPVTSDSNGRFSFYIADGEYDIKVSGSNITTYTISDIQIVDGYSLKTSIDSHISNITTAHNLNEKAAIAGQDFTGPVEVEAEQPYIGLNDTGVDGTYWRWISEYSALKLQRNQGTEDIPEWYDVVTFNLHTNEDYDTRLVGEMVSRFPLKLSPDNIPSHDHGDYNRGGALNVDIANLMGLANDVFTQYHNDTRGDIRYHTKTEFTDYSLTPAFAGIRVKDPYFDARAYGTLGTADDRTVLQAAISAAEAAGGGIVMIPVAGTLDISDYLEIDAHNVILQGLGWGPTIIRVAGTNDVLRLTGTSGSHKNNIKVRDIAFSRVAANPSAGNGIKAVYIDNLQVQNVWLGDQFCGVYLLGCSFAHLEDVQAIRYGTGANNFYGFYSDTAGGAANSSAYYKRCIVVATDSTGLNYGFYGTGTILADQFYDHCEVDIADYGWYLDASGGGGTDIHLVGCIADSIYNKGFYGNTLISGSIIGGWFQAANAGAETRGIELASCGRFAVNGVNHWGSGNPGYHRAVYINASHGVSVVGGTIHNAEYGVILYGGGNLSTIVGVVIYTDSVNPSTTMIWLTNSVARCGIHNNILTGYATNGILIDAGSTYNLGIGNQVEPTNITNEIVNNGGATNKFDTVEHNIIA